MAAGIEATILTLMLAKNHDTYDLMEVSNTLSEAAGRMTELASKHSDNVTRINCALNANPNDQEAKEAMEEELNEYYCKLADLNDFNKKMNSEKAKLETKINFENASIESFNKILNTKIKKDFTYGPAAGGG